MFGLRHAQRENVRAGPLAEAVLLEKIAGALRLHQAFVGIDHRLHLMLLLAIDDHALQAAAYWEPSMDVSGCVMKTNCWFTQVITA